MSGEFGSSISFAIRVPDFVAIAMKSLVDPADGEFLAVLHRLGPKTVPELGTATHVTATAVRHRLTRLQGAGLVVRELVRAGRGRPHYTYRVTTKGLRQLGDNYSELALILWREIRAIADPRVRELVTGRVREAMVSRFGQITGRSVGEKIVALREVMQARGYDVEDLATSQGLPILRENSCPYQELADEDRGICDLEQEVFQRVLGASVRLTSCCLDGGHCCDFEIHEEPALESH